MMFSGKTLMTIYCPKLQFPIKDYMYFEERDKFGVGQVLERTVNRQINLTYT